MQPDLSGSRTYTSPMCFQDSMDKELMAEHSLLDQLPDIVVKGTAHNANVNNRYVWTTEEVKLFLALIEEKNITAILDGKQRNSTIYQDLREDVIKRIRQALECVSFFAPTT